eukprot:CAMPEP_0172060388 /NCGR_PEP_ID=MMETSP1043-20130122/7931_1 /TAXON_ID=464988 /ORGANISM="Hemiselmis andersenii, Strain CCMP441" /LENGTH=180 /DNA_ID=CAMNT_0012720137 /DNA_START=65 /DNA_END=604 /DNA_ORIENTATION=+
MTNMLFSVEQVPETDLFFDTFSGFLPNPQDELGGGVEAERPSSPFASGSGPPPPSPQLEGEQDEPIIPPQIVQTVAGDFKPPAPPKKKPSFRAKVQAIRAFQSLSHTIQSKASISPEDYDAIVAASRGVVAAASRAATQQGQPQAPPRPPGAGRQPKCLPQTPQLSLPKGTSRWPGRGRG